jgi:hypothetical protein
VKVKRGEIVFIFFFPPFFRRNQKIKVSKVELNLNADRQNEIFQSVGKERGRRESEEFIAKSPSTCCGQGKFKLLLILRRSSMFINIRILVSISLSVVKPKQTNSKDYHNVH